MKCLSFWVVAVTDGSDPGVLEGIARTFGVQWHLLLAQIINFCVVAYLLYRLALKPVLRTLDERQKIISDGLQYAEEMKAQLAETEQKRLRILEGAHAEAKTWFEKAKEESTEYAKSQRQRAEERADEVLQQARESITLERSKMLKDVHSEVVQLVVTTTERILKKTLTEEDKAEFNRRALEDWSSKPKL
jgi:F-type H+-transporting ATPase subunit b